MDFVTILLIIVALGLVGAYAYVKVRERREADDGIGAPARPAPARRAAVVEEDSADVDELERFLTQARMDVVGVFGYSDEDGTEAESLSDKLPEHVVLERVERITGLVEELTAQRASERVGERVIVLVEDHDEDDEGVAIGRAEHQGPDVDGVCLVRAADGALPAVGQFVEGQVVDSVGVDLLVEVR